MLFKVEKMETLLLRLRLRVPNSVRLCQGLQAIMKLITQRETYRSLTFLTGIGQITTYLIVMKRDI